MRGLAIIAAAVPALERLGGRPSETRALLRGLADRCGEPRRMFGF